MILAKLFEPCNTIKYIKPFPITFIIDDKLRTRYFALFGFDYFQSLLLIYMLYFLTS